MSGMGQDAVTDHTDIRARYDAVRAEWAARSDSDPLKRIWDGYTAMRKLDPDILRERGRRVCALLDGEEAKVAPKRKTRAAPFTQAQVRRAIKSAESAGLRVKKVTVNKDGSVTVESGGNDVSSIDSHETSHAASWDDV